MIMMVDFGALPPEINSARMYSGAGSAPLLSAAAAWDGLAAELRSAATSYSSAISRLSSEGWRGPASISMAAAAAPLVAWMNTTGMHAEQTATQAIAAAGAYETAYSMTVPRLSSRPIVAICVRWSRPTFWGRTRRRSRPPRLTTAKCGRKTRPRCTDTLPLRRPPRR